MSFQDLKERLKHEILENNRRGTAQDFCDILKYDNDADVSAALAALEDENVAEVLETRTCYREDGGAITEGVYGISSTALTNRIMKEIEEVDKEYVDKYKLDDEKVRETYSHLRRRISDEIRNARTLRRH